LAQETVKLLRALAAERMRATGEETPVDAGHAATAPAPGEHVCTTGWCPICQVVGYVHDHPEMVEQVTETITDAAVQMGRAVREFLDKTLPPER
jgi:hypothetical protein